MLAADIRHLRTALWHCALYAQLSLCASLVFLGRVCFVQLLAPRSLPTWPRITTVSFGLAVPIAARIALKRSSITCLRFGKRAACCALHKTGRQHATAWQAQAARAGGARFERRRGPSGYPPLVCPLRAVQPGLKPERHAALVLEGEVHVRRVRLEHL